VGGSKKYIQKFTLEVPLNYNFLFKYLVVKYELSVDNSTPLLLGR